MEELVQKDRLYRRLYLFSPEEEKLLYEENKKDRFKGTLLLRSGTVTTLLIQFHHLKIILCRSLKEGKILYPLDLLSFLVTLRDTQKQILHCVYRDYKYAMDNSRNPKERFQKALNRNVGVRYRVRNRMGSVLVNPRLLKKSSRGEEYSPEKTQGKGFLPLPCVQQVLAFGKSQSGGLIRANFKQK